MPGPPERKIQGEVVGFRAWKVFDGALYGTMISAPWQPGENRAVCARGYDHAPDRECGCGIHSLARFPEDFPPADAGSQPWWVRGADVFGAITQWGRGNIRSLGFCSEYAQVVLLAFDERMGPEHETMVREFAQRYEADVCSRDQLEFAASEHGRLLTDEELWWAAKDDPETPPLWQTTLDWCRENGIETGIEAGGAQRFWTRGPGVARLLAATRSSLETRAQDSGASLAASIMARVPQRVLRYYGRDTPPRGWRPDVEEGALAMNNVGTVFELRGGDWVALPQLLA